MNENTDRLSDEAFAQQIIQGARRIQPDTLFATELEQTLLQTVPSKKSRTSSQRLVRMLGTMVAVLMLAFVGVLTVPPLRAIAQDIIDLFTRSEGDKVATFYTGEQPLIQTFKSVEEAETTLSRDFAAPRYLPSAMVGKNKVTAFFRYFTYYPERSSALIEYGFRMSRAWSMTFSQFQSESYLQSGGLLVGQSAEIETISFDFRGHPVSGQLVEGTWLFTTQADIPYSEMPVTPIPMDMEWSQNDKSGMTLVWEDEGIVYRLYASKNPYFDDLREELLRVAESIE